MARPPQDTTTHEWREQAQNALDHADQEEKQSRWDAADYWIARAQVLATLAVAKATADKH